MSQEVIAKELAEQIVRVILDGVDYAYDLGEHAEEIKPLLAAALASCAREAAKDEFTWAIDALKDMGHLDIAFKLLARHAALERAAGERAGDLRVKS